MSEPVAIICRIGRRRWVTRNGFHEQEFELLPLGEKERGERDIDEMQPQEVPERNSENAAQ